MDDIFGIINTVHDLSQKQSEFTEEVQNLNLTVITLKTALKNLQDRTNADNK